MKVALFIPCYIDQFYPEVGIATAKILRRFRINFDFPIEQTCCGQLAFNTGYRKESNILAVKFTKVFSDFDYIVSPSASCVNMVKNFFPELLNEMDFPNITQKIFELTEFIVKVLNLDSTGAEFEHTVTYHDSCHALRGLGIKNEPRLLLRNVKKLKFIEMENSEDCCGFGGIFSLKFQKLSVDMTKQKLYHILKTKSEFVTSIDQSCLMQIESYAKKHNLNIKTIHIAQILSNF